MYNSIPVKTMNNTEPAVEKLWETCGQTVLDPRLALPFLQ
jgi:hypothetical protein